jgi:hypothetical protein
MAIAAALTEGQGLPTFGRPAGRFREHCSGKHVGNKSPGGYKLSTRCL